MEYPFTIRPLTEDEGSGYLIEFTDLPGCISDGETPEEAVANGRDALKSWLRTAREFGDSIPKPGGSASGQWRQRVPKSLHARLAARARLEGVSLNTLADHDRRGSRAARVPIRSETVGSQEGLSATPSIALHLPSIAKLWRQSSNVLFSKVEMSS